MPSANKSAPQTATDRISSLRQMDARDLCLTTEASLTSLVEVMNQETILLRAGRYKEASELSPRKAEIAQTYVGLARAVQHEAERLKLQAPDALGSLQSGHEKLATQMAENLRVLATAKNVTENLLTDVATGLNTSRQPSTYGASGKMAAPQSPGANGIAVNRAL
ncbi:MAG TPA: hypothetical protein ENJ90_09015 [Devosia sp.]|nr:hypothetical protein [Devosia sp.]